VLGRKPSPLPSPLSFSLDCDPLEVIRERRVRGEVLDEPFLSPSGQGRGRDVGVRLRTKMLDMILPSPPFFSSNGKKDHPGTPSGVDGSAASSFFSGEGSGPQPKCSCWEWAGGQLSSFRALSNSNRDDPSQCLERGNRPLFFFPLSFK